MATGLVIHISSGDDRHTEILTDERIRIGNSESADLKLRSSSLPRNSTNGHLLELIRRDGSYQVGAFDTSLEVTKNSAEFAIGDEIEDGDEIRVVGSRPYLAILSNPFASSRCPKWIKRNARGPFH